MDKQQFWREKYKQTKPLWQDSLTTYEHLVRKHFEKNMKILDIGCGHADYFADLYTDNKNVFGLDPDQEALDKNKIIANENRKNGTAENIPFPNLSFDLVICAFVLEHVQNVEKAVSEISRVLKSGGHFIFLTPNKNNYIVGLNRIVPNALHSFFTKKLYGRQEHDTYPVIYRCNSTAEINKIMDEHRLTQVQLLFNEDPSYISFNYLFFYISCLMEKLIDMFFPSFKVHLIGIYQKKIK